MHGGTFSVYGECPTRGDINASSVMCGEPRIIVICPPAMEGFLHIFKPNDKSHGIQSMAFLITFGKPHF